MTTSSKVTATVDAAVQLELPPLHSELPDTEDHGRNARGEPEAMGTAIVPLELTVMFVQLLLPLSLCILGILAQDYSIPTRWVVCVEPYFP